jgi:hypothetical protein
MIDLKNLKFTDLLGETPETVEEVQEQVPEVEKKEEAPVKEQAKPEPEEVKEPEAAPEEKTEADEPRIITSIAESLGYTFEEGEEYPDDEDGLKSFVTKATEKMAGAQLLEFFGQFPEVEEFARYRINGGDPAKYFEAVSGGTIEKVVLKEDDEATQRAVVNKFLVKQGFEEAEITEMIDDYANTGLLFKQAKSAQTKLTKYSEAEHQRVIADTQKLKDKEMEDTRKLWNDVETTITTGVIRGIQVPEAEKKKFFEWMAKPVDKQGRSAREIAREKMDTESIVALEYLLYKNFDLGKLVMAKANTLQAKELRERLAGSTSSKKLSGTGTAPARKPDTLPSFKDLL